MPSKDRSDELLNNFLTSIHSVLPILDIESFKKKYDEFWYCGLFLQHNIEKLFRYYYSLNNNGSGNGEEDGCKVDIGVGVSSMNSGMQSGLNDFLYWYNKTSCLLNPSNLFEFCILLYAFFYASASSETYQLPPGQVSLLKKEVNIYYKIFQSVNSKNLNNPKTMSLEILQMNILIQSVVNLKNGKSLINIAKILRICQFYQFNRDPVVFHNLKDRDLVQSRRIIWWQIFQLDNLISFFLNLSPIIKLREFDTSLPFESLPNKNGPKNGSAYDNAYFFNSMFRFSLIVNHLIQLTNGLNIQLKSNDINQLKFRINDLFISCASSKLNIEKRLASNSMENAIDYDSAKYCSLMLSLLSDKVLIMFQKKILIIPYISAIEFQEQNLNLKLSNNTRYNYNYTDLSTNLLPSLLHYLSVFIEFSSSSLIKFNWQLKNFIPIDELILLMTILVSNLRNGELQVMNGQFNYDLNLKIYLVDKTIKNFQYNWLNKLSSLNKLTSIVSDLWMLIKLKYKLDLGLIDNYLASNKEFTIPSPQPTQHHHQQNQQQQQTQSKQHNSQQHHHQHQQQSANSSGVSTNTNSLFPDYYKSSNNNNNNGYNGNSLSPQNNSSCTSSGSTPVGSVQFTNCSEVAPRTAAGARESVTTSYNYNFFNSAMVKEPTSGSNNGASNGVLVTPLFGMNKSYLNSSVTLNTGEVVCNNMNSGNGNGDRNSSRKNGGGSQSSTSNGNGQGSLGNGRSTVVSTSDSLIDGVPSDPLLGNVNGINSMNMNMSISMGMNMNMGMGMGMNMGIGGDFGMEPNNDNNNSNNANVSNNVSVSTQTNQQIQNNNNSQINERSNTTQDYNTQVYISSLINSVSEKLNDGQRSKNHHASSSFSTGSSWLMNGNCGIGNMGGCSMFGDCGDQLDDGLDSGCGVVGGDDCECDSDGCNQGWLNLGTIEGGDESDLDDFHLYNNLKNDVLNLFTIIIK
ncbi:unnamed protein product [Ambrosiozyma monospora]|uniref:Unnamed protein product n=1 Tax=Ambrosiozyma monospora TaxID=43982 RepID=A0A9W6YTW5_AMBMO|nr:unnamed protein product [Ambrosiozyma monospora]